MPLPVAHSLLAASVVALIYSARQRQLWFLAMFIGVVIANCPDLDFIPWILFDSRGWHRGFTHSIGFSLLLSLLALGVVGWSHLRSVIAFGLAYMSHGVLDFATTLEGGGVKLLWPISDQRMALKLVSLSENALGLSFGEVISALIVETLIFLPLLILVILIKGWYLGPPSPKTGEGTS